MELYPKRPGAVGILVETRYEARSAAELEAASDGDFVPEWFEGETIVADALAARGSDPGSIRLGFASSEVVGLDDTRIRLRYRAEWTGFMEETDREVLGPSLAAELDDGDEFHIRINTQIWEDWIANQDPERSSESGLTYRWTIGEDPDPELVLERSAYLPAQDNDSAIGPGFGVLMALVALLALTAVGARRGGPNE